MSLLRLSSQNRKPPDRQIMGVSTMISAMAGKHTNDDQVKVAVGFDNNQRQLVVIRKTQRLSQYIKDLCALWLLHNPDRYGLKFGEGNPRPMNYITEQNRNEIKNGSFLELCLSAATVARSLINRLKEEKTPLKERVGALKQLSELTSDETFAREWVRMDGATLLSDYVQGKQYSGDYLAHALQSLLELMEHGLVDWNRTVLPSLVTNVAQNIKNTVIINMPRVLQPSLGILENFLLNGPEEGSVLVEKSVSDIQRELLPHLLSKDFQVQQNCVSFFNALFQRADHDKKHTYAKEIEPWFKVIFEEIIEAKGVKELGSEMTHQLYVLQSLILNINEEKRSKTAFQSIEKEGQHKLEALRATVNKNDFVSLGFSSENPLLELRVTALGMLALENMMYYARKKQEDYVRTIMENCSTSDSYRFLFGASCIELSKLLWEILHIGEPPSEEGEMLIPMFFGSSQNFCEELFCSCVTLAWKTWKEMEATAEDFLQVFVVIRDQIKRAVNQQPLKMAEFIKILKNLTYEDILQYHKFAQASKEQSEWTAKPIVELREKLSQEMVDIIRQQRIGYLVDGTRFNMYNEKGQRKKNCFMYWRLSQNRQVFHYGSCGEKNEPPVEKLKSRIQVRDVKALLTGKSCPHMQEGKMKKLTVDLVFTLAWESDGDMKYELFVAPDTKTFDYWTDGINALLNRPMTSKAARTDLTVLLDMETRLHLLDIEGIDIPNEPPPIPEHLPPDIPSDLFSHSHT